MSRYLENLFRFITQVACVCCAVACLINIRSWACVHTTTNGCGRRRSGVTVANMTETLDYLQVPGFSSGFVGTVCCTLYVLFSFRLRGAGAKDFAAVPSIFYSRVALACRLMPNKKMILLRISAEISHGQ